MSRVVNGFTLPTVQDLKDTNENTEWENLDTFLTVAAGNVNTSGEVTLRNSGSTAGAVVERLGVTDTEGLETKVFEKTIVCSPAGASFDLGFNFPANSLIMAVQANAETAITCVTAVAFGIGVSGTLNKYGESTTITKNSKIDKMYNAVITSEDDVKIYSTNGSGTAAGTMAGTVRVRVYYKELNSLDNAA